MTLREAETRMSRRRQIRTTQTRRDRRRRSRSSPRRGMEMTLRRSRLFRMRFHMGSRTGKSSTIQ